MTISPEQVRAARALLGLGQTELARRAGVSAVTIRRLEAAGGRARVASVTVGGVQRALEQAGAEFITDGVRRRRAAGPGARPLYDDLHAISVRSAARLRGRGILTDADLYDEDGVPA